MIRRATLEDSDAVLHCLHTAFAPFREYYSPRSLVTLDTTAPLQRAIRFYARHGYRASGKVGDFYGMPLFEYVKQF